MQATLERIWWRKNSKFRSLLEPPLAVGSLFYRVGMNFDQWRKRRSAKKLPRPVLSVGNLTVGGTGKTPLALWLADRVTRAGKVPCILTRGYGASSKGPRRVDPDCMDWREYGDEPLLMAQRLEKGGVYVGSDRYRSGILALEREKEIDLFILDDGFQHRSLARDYDIVLVDAEREFGNGRLLPWGPLREPIDALERADAVGRVSRTGQFTTARESFAKPADLNIGIGPVGWRYLGREEVHPLDSLPTHRKARLLSGIGSPGGFEATVRSCEAPFDHHSIYPDHHPFTPEQVRAEVESALAKGALLLTTAKDGIRLESSGFLWTEENRPLIIEVSLFPGDGADYLNNALNKLIG